jgi:hypothetical protein
MPCTGVDVMSVTIGPVTHIGPQLIGLIPEARNLVARVDRISGAQASGTILDLDHILLIRCDHHRDKPEAIEAR